MTEPRHWPGLDSLPTAPPSTFPAPPPPAPPGGNDAGPEPAHRNGAWIFVAVALVAALVTGAIAFGWQRSRQDNDTAAAPTTTPTAPTPNVPTTTKPPTTKAPNTTAAPEPSPPASGGDFQPRPVQWKACSPGGYDCGSVDVPLDYDHPDGRTISLALKRHRATDQTGRVGSVFYNPGGPGGSGIDALEDAVSHLSHDVQARFDIVSWDPRGAGKSSPIDCDDGAIELYSKDLNQLHPGSDVDTAAKNWAEECQRNSGDILPFVGTNDVARDLESLRQAVGDDKLTYLGVSYGTEIGLVYAQRYPTHIWYHNLLTNPLVSAEIGTHRRTFRATVATGEQRSAIMARHKQMQPAFADYETRTTREIPVVILEPAAPTSGEGDAVR